MDSALSEHSSFWFLDQHVTFASYKSPLFSPRSLSLLACDKDRTQTYSFQDFNSVSLLDIVMQQMRCDQTGQACPNNRHRLLPRLAHAR